MFESVISSAAARTRIHDEQLELRSLPASINSKQSAMYLGHDRLRVSRSGRRFTRRVVDFRVRAANCGGREHAAVLRPVEEWAQNRHGHDKPHGDCPFFTWQLLSLCFCYPRRLLCVWTNTQDVIDSRKTEPKMHRRSYLLNSISNAPYSDLET